MKSSIVLTAFALAISGSHGFSPSRGVQQSSTTLAMGGFLEGRVPKNDIMKKEDEAMWVDDEGSDSESGGGWNPFKIASSFDSPKKKAVPSKKGPAKKKEEPPKKAGGFKMPWDK